ncbi:TRAP transporter small permease subunit [Mangrovicoccus algicola]|uniref:TRAP transporter small permease protein n=1 Tax=Mangrovicoccus algicola TaxID=2771008 RepID=A0A8J7CK84_9RHOB|nr:TRAP transporter small permease [Mangrovicoccus algicola]MBE3638446.1 TRAP transporter small permease [Mangrovicoccus algicola]
MTQQSIWLGPLRRPVGAVALAACAVAALTFLWLILQQFTAAEPIGMYDMLRPAGRLSVLLMLWSLFAAVLAGAAWLSDTVAPLESAPTGPFDILSLICARVAMIGILGIVLAMSYEVVARYAFEKPTLWANELSLWIAGFVFLLAGLYAMQQRSHIRIFVIYDLMPHWARKAADVLSVFLVCFFAFCMVWGGWNEVVTKLARMETFGTAWDPPIPATIKAAILFNIVLVAIQAVSNLIADWHKAPESHSPMDDIDQAEIENIRRTLKED